MIYDLTNCVIITILVPDRHHTNQSYIHSVLIPHEYTFIVSRLIVSIVLSKYIENWGVHKKRFLEEYAKL